MTKDQFIEWAKSRGWQTDPYGHLQKEAKGQRYRFKLTAIAARYEVKTSSGWLRLRSGYFSCMTASPDGKLTGMAR